MEWIPRQHPRFKAVLPVELRPLGQPVPLRAQTKDISLGGIYVEMILTQKVSTEVDITLWIRERKIRAKGVVVSLHPAFGNGIKFTEFADEDRKGLQQFVDDLGIRPKAASMGAN
ncbi:MAG TPA: PilZ domain-containing protein [Candidatus Sulfotelmatobacter sp.]|nr:PilZ domain-containing protein [Candidatus Sulfotelmatobacter sp.]